MNINQSRLEIGGVLFLIFSLVLLVLTGNIFSSKTAQQQLHIPYAIAATSSAVTVTASIAQNISCSTNTTSSAFGTLTDASVATAATNASTTISCGNISSGCSLSINDAGSGANPGLWNASSSALIESPNVTYDTTSTLVAGTEGFGIQGTTTASGSGGALTLTSRYLQTGNVVAGLTTTTLTLASSSAAASGREVVVTHKAAIASSSPSGNYTDTITYSCLAN